MDALEAQRIAQDTQDILAIEDAEEPIVSALTTEIVGLACMHSPNLS